MKLKINQKVTLEIKRLGSHGEGVGNLDGYTLFVDQALPGEIVKAKITLIKKTYGRATLVEIESKSPTRVTPPCPYFHKCGGCQTQHMSYEHQLEMKTQRVIDAFERIGKFSDCQIYGCVPSPKEFNYRNKMQVAFGINKIGYFRRNTRDVIDIETCMIHNDLGESVYKLARSELLKSSIPVFNSTTEKGQLRHLIIKSALETEQVLVIIVAKSDISKSLKTIANNIIKTSSHIKGVLLNVNANPNNVVLGKHYRLLAGRDFIEEQLSDLTFKISPSSFFQVNPYQAHNVYKEALNLADLKGDEVVFDPFCGTGTLSLLFAQKTKHVFGVEVVKQAIEDAKYNAQINDIKNVTFECNLAEKWIANAPDVDVALLNPPRKGCDLQLIHSLSNLKPTKIIYISCDPATLARDARLLSDSGYTLKSVKPFDMFPQTAHVESVALLTYKIKH